MFTQPLLWLLNFEKLLFWPSHIELPKSISLGQNQLQINKSISQSIKLNKKYIKQEVQYCFILIF